MATLLIDANLDGQGELLALRLRSDNWKDIADYIGERLAFFSDIGLDRAAPDAVVWRLCQERSFYLLTGNRNHDGDDSLEATLRREACEDSLPVFTISNADAFLRSAAYREKVIDSLLGYLLDEQRYRGAGRLYLP